MLYFQTLLLLAAPLLLTGLPTLQPINAKPAVNAQPVGRKETTTDYLQLQAILGAHIPGTNEEKAKVVKLVLQLLAEIDLRALCDVIANETKGNPGSEYYTHAPEPTSFAWSESTVHPRSTTFPRLYDNTQTTGTTAYAVTSRRPIVENQIFDDEKQNQYAATGDRSQRLKLKTLSKEEQNAILLNSFRQSDESLANFDHQLGVIRPTSSRIVIPNTKQVLSLGASQRSHKLTNGYPNSDGTLHYPVGNKFSQNSLSDFRLKPIRQDGELKQKMRLRSVYKDGYSNTPITDISSSGRNSAENNIVAKSMGVEKPRSQLYSRGLLLGDWLKDDVSDLANEDRGNTQMPSAYTESNAGAERSGTPFTSRSPVAKTGGQTHFQTPQASFLNSRDEIMYSVEGKTSSPPFERQTTRRGSEQQNNIRARRILRTMSPKRRASYHITGEGRQLEQNKGRKIYVGDRGYIRLSKRRQGSFSDKGHRGWWKVSQRRKTPMKAFRNTKYSKTTGANFLATMELDEGLSNMVDLPTATAGKDEKDVYKRENDYLSKFSELKHPDSGNNLYNTYTRGTGEEDVETQTERLNRRAVTLPSKSDTFDNTRQLEVNDRNIEGVTTLYQPSSMETYLTDSGDVWDRVSKDNTYTHTPESIDYTNKQYSSDEVISDYSPRPIISSGETKNSNYYTSPRLGAVGYDDGDIGEYESVNDVTSDNKMLSTSRPEFIDTTDTATKDVTSTRSSISAEPNATVASTRAEKRREKIEDSTLSIDAQPTTGAMAEIQAKSQGAGIEQLPITTGRAVTDTEAETLPLSDGISETTGSPISNFKTEKSPAVPALDDVRGFTRTSTGPTSNSTTTSITTGATNTIATTPENKNASNKSEKDVDYTEVSEKLTSDSSGNTAIGATTSDPFPVEKSERLEETRNFKTDLTEAAIVAQDLSIASSEEVKPYTETKSASIPKANRWLASEGETAINDDAHTEKDAVITSNKTNSQQQLEEGEEGDVAEARTTVSNEMVNETGSENDLKLSSNEQNATGLFRTEKGDHFTTESVIIKEAFNHVLPTTDDGGNVRTVDSENFYTTEKLKDQPEVEMKNTSALSVTTGAPSAGDVGTTDQVTLSAQDTTTGVSQPTSVGINIESIINDHVKEIQSAPTNSTNNSYFVSLSELQELTGKPTGSELTTIDTTQATGGEMMTNDGTTAKSNFTWDALENRPNKNTQTTESILTAESRHESVVAQQLDVIPVEAVNLIMEKDPGTSYNVPKSNLPKQNILESTEKINPNEETFHTSTNIDLSQTRTDTDGSGNQSEKGSMIVEPESVQQFVKPVFIDYKGNGVRPTTNTETGFFSDASGTHSTSVSLPTVTRDEDTISPSLTTATTATTTTVNQPNLETTITDFTNSHAEEDSTSLEYLEQNNFNIGNVSVDNGIQENGNDASTSSMDNSTPSGIGLLPEQSLSTRELSELTETTARITTKKESTQPKEWDKTALFEGTSPQQSSVENTSNVTSKRQKDDAFFLTTENAEHSGSQESESLKRAESRYNITVDELRKISERIANTKVKLTEMEKNMRLAETSQVMETAKTTSSKPIMENSEFSTSSVEQPSLSNNVDSLEIAFENSGMDSMEPTSSFVNNDASEAKTEIRNWKDFGKIEYIAKAPTLTETIGSSSRQEISTPANIDTKEIYKIQVSPLEPSDKNNENHLVSKTSQNNVSGSTDIHESPIADQEYVSGVVSDVLENPITAMKEMQNIPEENRSDIRPQIKQMSTDLVAGTDSSVEAANIFKSTDSVFDKSDETDTTTDTTAASTTDKSTDVDNNNTNNVIASVTDKRNDVSNVTSTLRSTHTTSYAATPTLAFDDMASVNDATFISSTDINDKTTISLPKSTSFAPSADGNTSVEANLNETNRAVSQTPGSQPSAIASDIREDQTINKGYNDEDLDGISTKINVNRKHSLRPNSLPYRSLFASWTHDDNGISHSSPSEYKVRQQFPKMDKWKSFNRAVAQKKSKLLRNRAAMQRRDWVYHNSAMNTGDGGYYYKPSSAIVKDYSKHMKDTASGYLWNSKPWSARSPSEDYRKMEKKQTKESLHKAAFLESKAQYSNRLHDQKIMDEQKKRFHHPFYPESHTKLWGDRFSQGFFGRVYDNRNDFARTKDSFIKDQILYPDTYADFDSARATARSKDFENYAPVNRAHFPRESENDAQYFYDDVLSSFNPAGGMESNPPKRFSKTDIEKLFGPASSDITGVDNAFLRSHHDANERQNDVIARQYEDRSRHYDYSQEGRYDDPGQQDFGSEDYDAKLDHRDYSLGLEENDFDNAVDQETPSDAAQGHIETSIPDQTQGVPVGDEFKCPGLFGYHSDPKNCQAFFICSWGDAYRLQCPPGTLWNSKITVCDWAVNVDCPVAYDDEPVMY